MIEGMLESLAEPGVFVGWLRDSADPAPCIVEIRLAGQPVAHAVASAFRPDLLRGGHGNGHYGFRARLLRRLPPGQAAFELFLPRQGQGVRAVLAVPPLAPAAPVQVEDLLRPEPAWTVTDLAPALACLALPARLRQLGPARFIDAAYRLALLRWPSAAEQQTYARALQDGSATADDVVRELLLSRERQDLGPGLMSPWDPGFPFAVAPAD